MQQKEPVRPEEWNDRTLTTLRTSRLEACEKELAGLGGSGLFDAETTDLEAETLFGQSYDLEEERKKRLHRGDAGCSAEPLPCGDEPAERGGIHPGAEAGALRRGNADP